VLDSWLGGLDDEMFSATVPLLRRAFAAFAGPERRSMGELVKVLGAADSDRPAAGDEDLDQQRADRVMPVLAQVLGTSLGVAP
jgi:Family of unknown function (DUF5682)